MALGSTQPLSETSTRNLPGGKGWPVRKATLPPSVSRLSKKTWEPWRFTNLWASTVCYGDSFTSLTLFYGVFRIYAVQRSISTWMVSRKGSGWKHYWLNQGIISSLALRDGGKPWKLSIRISGIGFEVLIAPVMQNSFFWDITPYYPLKDNRRFRGTCRLFQGCRTRTVCCLLQAGFLLGLFLHLLNFNGLHSLISQKNSQWPNRDLNWALPEYKSRVLPPRHLARRRSGCTFLLLKTSIWTWAAQAYWKLLCGRAR
jgi:hypothetical protein